MDKGPWKAGKTKTNAVRQKEFTARMKARGLVKISVWVPRSTVEKVKAFAKKLRGGK